ncbi:MAG: rhomboid family intramembrane serine protease [Phycisphaerae bacterium]|nr:rhomboid family intramembrane serine protease [Phycisphaerae bacterium]
MIHLRCSCGKALRLSEAYLGQTAACPVCKKLVGTLAGEVRQDVLDFQSVLTVEQGPDRVGEQWFLGGGTPIQIGKLASKHLVLHSPHVSRTHCRLVRVGDDWELEDLGSRNGSFVNEIRVERQMLADGDLVRVGEYHLRYRIAPGQQAMAARTVAAPANVVTDIEMDDEDDGLYALAATEAEQPAVALEPEAPEAMAAAPEAGRSASTTEVPAGDGPTCPCCKKTLSFGAKICVECGINVATGRAILISQDTNLDAIYTHTEGILRWLSWIIWIGLYPIASEAFGTRKPYVTWAIAALTVLVSVWFGFKEFTGSPDMQQHKNLMLWAGKAEPTPEHIEAYYTFTAYGDSSAFFEKLDELEASQDRDSTASTDDLIREAHESLPPERQCFGRYEPAQLITHAFLHGGVLHLAGNMLFLLVIGSRVNALVGNIVTAVLYPLLAIAAALCQMASVSGEPPMPMLGASGAVMGLAGMYLILFPLPKVHMVFWYRLGLIFAFRLALKLFAVRGFWVVLFYIAFDVVATVWQAEDGVAHWAHLGGFIAGAAVALFLLLSRLVNSRGGDLISALLGRHAWALIGRPNRPSRTLP